MEQFLTGDIWNEVNKNLKGTKNNIACIAYITSNQLKLKKGDILVCDASDYSIKQGSTSAEIIESYFNKGVVIYNKSVLHSKLLLTEKFIVIGSANLSSNSAKNLIESAVLTDNGTLISQTKAFCHNLIEESIKLTKQSIDELKKIPVIKRGSKPPSKSKVRRMKFGNSHWIVPIVELSNNLYNPVRFHVEKTKKNIAETENIKEEQIGYLRCRIKSKFTKNAKIGDQIILIWSNKEKTRRIVYHPATILKIEKDENIIHIYHDDLNSEKKESWTKFKLFIKKHSLNIKTIKPPEKFIPQSDFNKLKLFWQ